MTFPKNDVREARSRVEQFVFEGLHGPGSDTFGLPKDEERISDYPLRRYFTGILFPKRKVPNSFSERDEAEGEARTAPSDDDRESSAPSEGSTDEAARLDRTSQPTNGRAASDQSEDEERETRPGQFYPNSMGLTFCVADDTETITVVFSFGLYRPVRGLESKIAISEADYETLRSLPDYPFEELVTYRDGTMHLTRDLKETDYREKLKKLKKSASKEHRRLVARLDKLMGRTWKRTPVVEQKTISLSEAGEPIPVFEGEAKAEARLKVYRYDELPDDKKYCKVTLVNASEALAANQFSSRNKRVNTSSLFQTRIRLKAPAVQPYNSYRELSPIDEEARRLNFQYRDVQSYGIGHGCAVAWDREESEIETTYFPGHSIRDTENEFDEAYLRDVGLSSAEIEAVEEALTIRSLSTFSELPKETVLGNLDTFAGAYERWIEQQKQQAASVKAEEQDIADRLVDTLDRNAERLREGVQRLREDPAVYDCFRRANTAMLIQLVISNDERFGGAEKSLVQRNDDVSYDQIDVFAGYDEQADEPLAWRPFQLAFFLLNLTSCTEPDSSERRDLVDLLWFPTGGGKTEAYLAVAAFTILWRRLQHDGAGGTSVIMRYTLRLLTTQQFERASRLIAALEFLRRREPDVLGETPISIGLWVGRSSTPNKLSDARSKADSIAEKVLKSEGDPKEENVFQISACPWCGCKLIDEEAGLSGFEGSRSGFEIKCNNDRCVFSDKLPVQVVDEALYKEPPTLLFATVDKLAVLAWRAEGHCFFNSLEPGRPPDLIIQDELHLLSGPLGSMTGLFENVVELLCTKGDHKPKVIASTATTRNTEHQVSELYAGREVNVFPPPGLTHRDSFFSRESDQPGRRRYVGFMPTGKSFLETQLRVLAHLLVSRLEVYEHDLEVYEHDPVLTNLFWTVVSYYGSLKHVGKLSNKVQDEIYNYTAELQNRLFAHRPEYDFNRVGLSYRHEELTSRIDSARIKSKLDRLEAPFRPDLLYENDDGSVRLERSADVVDLVLATNMISVGLDVDRLNLMLVNGQPRNKAEYIQATSRVARSDPGLVLTLFDSYRARDRSHFEHFVPFHQAFYKYIEPISLTTLTESTLDKMATSLLITYVRHKRGLWRDEDAGRVAETDVDLTELFEHIDRAYPANKATLLKEHVTKLLDEWKEIARTRDGDLVYGYSGDFMKRPVEQEPWSVMQSMREVDTSTYAQIQLPDV